MNSKTLRLAMLGMIPGNGHPYSWSAIVNGFSDELLRVCPYPVIGEYMTAARKRGPVGIDGARVTHIWTDDPAEAKLVARAALIEHVVNCPEDVIGKVDAVLVATDDGDDHIRRVQPFIDAGLPVFVDKPLATNLGDLRQFCRWVEQGALITSSSGLRYAPEIVEAGRTLGELGQLRWIVGATCKTWERYAIHVLEPVASLLGRGFLDIRLCAEAGRQVAIIRHRCGVTLTIGVFEDAYGSFGSISFYGTAGVKNICIQDTYSAFRSQLVGFVDFVQSGHHAIAFEETVELMLVLIAGRRSKSAGGARVAIDTLRGELIA